MSSASLMDRRVGTRISEVSVSSGQDPPEAEGEAEPDDGAQDDCVATLPEQSEDTNKV